jgi:UDP:flavonoid glycosyltransferase YjiC (YdhE family)
MPRIVMTSWGSYGDLFPFIGLGLELRRRGHEAVLAMPALYRERVECEGLAFRAVRPDLDVNDRAFAARVMDPVRGTEELFERALMPALEQTHADLLAASEGADLIVGHPASLVAPIVAEERGLVWASTVLAPMSFFSVTDPVVPPPAPWVWHLTSRSRLLSRGFVAMADRLTRRWAGPVQRLRASRGLGPTANPILAGQHSPHLVLGLFSRLLADPQPDWPARTVVTGPVLYNGPGSQPLAPELAEFLDAGPPPIVFTLGTSAVFVAGRFYEAGAEAVRRLGRRAVLLVGPDADGRSAPTPDVLAVEFAPHAALFPRAAAIVHQGGVGTLHQALASGRPMLVVPHAHDQPDNARRAERLGVARTLCPRRVHVAAVARELKRLLDDPRYASRAQSVGTLVRAENGAGSAADAIDALVSSRRH